MAYDYDKVKQQYESLDANQRNQFADMMKGSGNYADFMSRYNAEKSTPAQTTTSTSRDIAKPEYQGTGSSGAKSSPYENQGEGNYYYSNQTNRYEKYPTATQTSTQTTKVETPAEDDTVKQLRDAWNNKSYEEQQKLLKSNPAMQNTLTKYGITNKQPEATTQETTPTQTETPATQQGAEWDYQDNSQARIDQIIRNLDGFRVSDPYLFDNYDTFYNAFIAGKGRSQDQINTLNDYFKKMKQYNEFDNQSAGDIGYGLAYGKVPSDYLNYLKNSDPQKYQEVIQARKEAEDDIKNKTVQSTIEETQGTGKSSTNEVLDWLEKNGLFLDKDGNLIDDRTEVYASDEEKGYQTRIADIYAEMLDIDNTIKHTYDDLVDRYPGASKATLMAMAQDTNADLLRKKEDLAVEATKLQGYVGYMQQEREDRMKIGENAINQLQKQYGMYYDYSPEGMSALAQAKYAATNVTLDQADKGTDTQKQMALESILSPVYEQYGSIIERPMAQVINNVMSYAKKNGITLSQALKENFTDKLKSKEAYQAMQGQLTEPNLQIIGYNSDGKAVYGYWDSATKTFKSVTASGVDGGTSEGTSYVTNVQPLNNFITNLENKYTIASNGGTGGSKIRGGGCGTVVNDYLGSVGDNIKLKEANDIKPYATSRVPAEGAVAYFDGTQSRATPETKKHGHVGIVVSDNGDTITVLESNEGTGLRYNDYKKSSVTGYYVPEGIKTNEYKQSEYGDAFIDAANIIKPKMPSNEARSDFMDTIQGYLDKGKYTTAYEYIMSNARNVASDSATREKLNAAETAMIDLVAIKDALEAYYAAGGETGILQGNLEDVANALGDTTDPRLVGLSTKIAEAIQAYRKNISGTAFSEKEAKDYEKLFPTLKAGEEYNTAKLEEVLNSMIIRANGLYGNLIGPNVYRNLLTAHENAAGRKYSAYEEQSDLYKYLLENGYLNADGTVKSEDDLASWYAQYNQRKGKRF